MFLLNILSFDKYAHTGGRSFMNLQELFNQCLENNNGDKTKAAQQFIIKAKKENPSVKMNECMAIAGYDKKNEQNFRNNIVIPVRNRIANIKFNIDSNTIKKIFGRSQKELTDEEKNTKKRSLNNETLC
jgi:hypothetical protein